MNILALCWDLFLLTCTAGKPRDRDIWSVDLGNKTEESSGRKNKQGHLQGPTHIDRAGKWRVDR